jgi:hypothetical protein
MPKAYNYRNFALKFLYRFYNTRPMAGLKI